MSRVLTCDEPLRRKQSADAPSGAAADSAVLPVALAVCLGLIAAGCGETQNPDPLPNMQVVKSIRSSVGDESGGDESEAVSTGEGWGTLRGRFVLSGTAPSLPNIAATKDTEVCGKVPLIDERLVVGDDKAIANVVVFAAKPSRVNPDALDSATSNPAEFDQKNCVFSTHVLPVVVGQPIALKNSDPVGHNVNISPTGDKTFNQLLATGGEAEFAFGRRQSSPIPVACNVHPWMRAYMFPRDDPYVAVTGADGSFEIANLPAGEDVEIRVWHESAPEGLEAKSDWSKGRFVVNIEADGVEDLGTIEVPVEAFSGL
ncbi:MAG: hypothetical protein R3C10_23005 [Pirellulales bacterium]|nr:hypothetical protein [Planctomycetales bacterium]